MATLYEQCDAIDADPILTGAEKLRQKANLKAAGLRDALLGVGGWTLPKTFAFSKSGHAYSVTVTAVSVTSRMGDDGLVRDALRFDGAATRDGAPMKNADGSPLFPIIIVNPPCLIADGVGPVTRDGTRKCTYDLVTMAQSILTGVVGG